MKNPRRLFVLLAVFLTSCSLLPTPAPPPEPTWTPSLSPTATTTAFTFPETHTPAPERTVTPTPDISGTAAITATATRSGPTPTFDTSAAATRRPAAPALCPPRIVGIQGDEAGWDEMMAEGRTVELLEALQFYLNQGGSFATAAAALDTYRGQGGLSFFRETDLTGDGVSELLAVGPQAYVFWCEAGFIELRVIPDSSPEENPELVHIGDLNITGIPEIVLYWGDTCGTESCGALAVLEWDGELFISLVEDQGGDLARLGAAFEARFADVEGNGTVEIVLEGGIPLETSDAFRDGLPWRNRIDTYMWNGERFVRALTRFTLPTYRFQALQDGDRQTLQGEFEQAALSYQNVIFGVSLEWWTPERADYLQALWDIENGRNIQAPEPPVQDPTELDYLGAYGRFRLMLLYLLQGWEGDAETVYDSLLLTYPEGEPGAVFAVMAAAFWEAYEATGSIGAACPAASAVAEENPEALFYLGAAHHGAQSVFYSPVDVCPFWE